MCAGPPCMALVKWYYVLVYDERLLSSPLVYSFFLDDDGDMMEFVPST
jgi:hypothetical protein